MNKLLLFLVLTSVKGEFPSLFQEDIIKVFDENKDGLSEKCQEMYQANNYSNLLTMMDLSSKFFPTALSSGNLYDFGHFDACYNFEIKNEDVFGKYCFAQISVPGLEVQPSISVCMLSICTSSEVQNLVNSFLSILQKNLTVQINSNACSSKSDEPEWSSGAITTIVVLGIFLLLGIMSTIYEVYLYYTETEAISELFLAFSFWRNSNKILSTTTNQNQLLCLNGIRAISMVWIVVGHLFSSVMMIPADNVMEIFSLKDDQVNQYVIGAGMAVDTFFTLGGIVTVYAFLSSMDRGVKFNIFKYYLHRYLRLTPALAIMILVNAFLAVHMGNGPFWPNLDTILGANCRKYWWSALLYIQNFVNVNETCVTQSWYLSVDMQLFLLSPLVLVPLYKYPKFTAKFILPSLILAGFLSPFLITYFYELSAEMTSFQQSYMEYYYMQTHARFGPYVIGMFFGYVIFTMKKSKKNFRTKENNLTACIMWIIVVCGLYGCVFGVFYNDDSRISASFLNSFNKNAWALVISLVVILCVFGYGGPVNSFLSWGLFQIIAKFSYSIYIVHYSFITLRSFSMRHQQHFTQKYMWWSFWGDFMISVLFAFIYCILFESPIVTLEKFIFGKGKKKSKGEGQA